MAGHLQCQACGQFSPGGQPSCTYCGQPFAYGQFGPGPQPGQAPYGAPSAG